MMRYLQSKTILNANILSKRVCPNPTFCDADVATIWHIHTSIKRFIDYDYNWTNIVQSVRQTFFARINIFFFTMRIHFLDVYC